MNESRVAKVLAEMDRLQDAVKALRRRNDVFTDVAGEKHHRTSPQSASVRRASMDLTRALADLRR